VPPTCDDRVDGLSPSLRADYGLELLEAVDQGFCTIEVLLDDDGRPSDYRFLHVNAAFEAQTGLRDAVGKRMRELAPTHEEHWFQTYGQVALTGVAARFEHEAAALGRWFDVYAFRVGEAQARHVALLFSDITMRRRAELDLLQARRQAEAANRAKDDFLAMLSHELRNPLAPIVTALQLLRLRGTVSREHLVIERQVNLLRRLVDDLLDVSRIASGKLELRRRPIELREVVLAAMELSGPLLEQRQHLVEVDVPRQDATIDVDPDRMAQVVSNLLTNAAKYSAAASRIQVRGWRDGGTVNVCVIDEGSGIATDMLQAVFEPFVQQPTPVAGGQGGLGLGLAIVRSIVEAHGGTVRAESRPNEGSTFIVALPAVDH
jgi:signal transduction histidine kinase